MTPQQQEQRRRAEGHYQAGEWAPALTEFDTLLQAGVRDGNLLHDRAVCVFQLGRKKEALDQLDEAVALEPDNPYRYSSRAWIRAALKDVDGAIEDYRKALDLDPDDAITLNNLGLLEEQYGMRKAAQEKFKRADTLMGILRDAGVDPADAAAQPADTPEPASNAAPTEDLPPTSEGSLLGEIKAVFTTPGRGREFLQFLKNGLRR